MDPHLVRIRTRTSDYRIRIWLLSSVTLRMPKKFFFIFFLITYQQAHYLQSLTYCFKEKFCVKIKFSKHYFSLLNTFMRKGKDPAPELNPYIWLRDPDLGGPKTCGSCGSGYPTLKKTLHNQIISMCPPFCELDNPAVLTVGYIQQGVSNYTTVSSIQSGAMLWYL